MILNRWEHIKVHVFHRGQEEMIGMNGRWKWLLIKGKEEEIAECSGSYLKTDKGRRQGIVLFLAPPSSTPRRHPDSSLVHGTVGVYGEWPLLHWRLLESPEHVWLLLVSPTRGMAGSCCRGGAWQAFERQMGIKEWVTEGELFCSRDRRGVGALALLSMPHSSLGTFVDCSLLSVLFVWEMRASPLPSSM